MQNSLPYQDLQSTEFLLKTERVAHYILEGLNKVGFCVVDSFLGYDLAYKVLLNVQNLHLSGSLSDGQVVSQAIQDQVREMIRGDKIAWVGGHEDSCKAISKLITQLNSIIFYANKHQNAGKLGAYNITSRTKAMVACYPGKGTRYVKHIDNPDGNGRCLTAIYYLNHNWKPEDGGILRIYPEEMENSVAEIEPRFDRLLCFWSDKRNPHEVLPSSATRYAITVWYLDQKEAAAYKTRNTEDEHG